MLLFQGWGCLLFWVFEFWLLWGGGWLFIMWFMVYSVLIWMLDLCCVGVGVGGYCVLVLGLGWVFTWSFNGMVITFCYRLVCVLGCLFVFVGGFGCWVCLWVFVCFGLLFWVWVWVLVGWVGGVFVLFVLIGCFGLVVCFMYFVGFTCFVWLFCWLFVWVWCLGFGCDLLLWFFVVGVLC